MLGMWGKDGRFVGPEVGSGLLAYLVLAFLLLPIRSYLLLFYLGNVEGI